MLKQVDFGVLTRTAARIECLSRAAPKSRHVLFSMTGCAAFAPMHALWPVSSQQVIAMTHSAPSHLLPVFARVELGFERGEGAWLIATNGERYLDFTSGVAVNALGHAHPHLIAAIGEQAQKLWHVSNLYRIPEAERLAERLCRASFADVAFFANSGAE